MNFLDTFKKIRQWIADVWERTEKRDRTRFFLISGVSVAVIILAVALLSKVNYVTLAQNLSDDDANAIVTALTSQSIANKTQSSSGGITVLVGSKQKTAAAAYLSANNIPNDNPSYDLYQNASGLTVTQSERDQYAIYQLQADIRKYLRGIDNVKDATVLLAVPQQKASLFASNNLVPTASVNITTKDGSTPSNSLVQVVKKATASAVVGLKPENVTVTSQNGLVLGDSADGYNLLLTNFEFQNQVELDMESGVRSLLNLMLGMRNFGIKAYAKLNFDTHTQEKMTFLPSIDENGIIESHQILKEEMRGNYNVSGEPGADEDGMGDLYAEGEENDSNYYIKSSETLNYKVNQIIDYIESAKGKIEKLTFTVTINKAVLQESANNTKMIKQLIGGAIGLTKESYDSITVVYSDFSGLQQEDDDYDAYLAAQKRQEIFDLLKTLGLYAVILVCVILLVSKLFTFFRITQSEAERLAMEKLSEINDEMEAVALTAGVIRNAPKSPFRLSVEEFVEKNPSAVSELVRNWLEEDNIHKSRR